MPGVPLLRGQRHDQERGHGLLRDLRRGEEDRRRRAGAGRCGCGSTPRSRGPWPATRPRCSATWRSWWAAASRCSPTPCSTRSSSTWSPRERLRGAGPPDAAVEAYVEAIEAHLRARRGAEHILSPRDFALARSWHQAGVPLATVLVGIDRAFDSGADVTSLAFCRRRVEDLVAAGPRPAGPAQPGVRGSAAGGGRAHPAAAPRAPGAGCARARPPSSPPCAGSPRSRTCWRWPPARTSTTCA